MFWAVSCLLRPERGAIPCANLLSLLLLFIFTSNFILFVFVLMALALTQTGLDILGWSDSPASVFRISGATRVHHYTLLSFCVWKVCWSACGHTCRHQSHLLFFKKRFKLFYYLMCRIVLPECIYVYHMHTVPQEFRRGCYVPWDWNYKRSEPPDRSWTWNSGPLKEQSVVLTTEPSF